jgi:hypothetical protein
MPVYELVLQQPSGIDRARYGEHLPTEIGDGLTIDDAPWVVIAKEPAFRTTPHRAARLQPALDSA